MTKKKLSNISTSSPASAASPSQQNKSGPTSNTSSATTSLSHKKFSGSIGQRRKSTETSVLLQTPTSTMHLGSGQKANGESWGLQHQIKTALISSREASLASLFPRQDEDAARKMTAISGRRCFELYESFIPTGSSLRMFAASLLGTMAWYSNKCTLTWKVKVTPSKRLLFLLSPSTLPTAETEFGLLRTPNAEEMEGRGEYKDIEKMKERWKKHQPLLNQQIAVHGAKAGLKLQPAFVEWMMGFPEGWTEIPDSKLSAMQLSRKSRRQSLKR